MGKLCLVAIALLCMVTESMEQGRPMKMSFKPPPVNEEMEHSQHVPGTMDCEACAGIAYQLTEKIREMHKTKYPQNKIKPESILLETVDNICASDTFNGYGPKGIGGEAKLSGPGLNAGDEAGMMMGGGKWPNRMAQRCNEYRGDLDENVMYNMVRGGKSLLKPLCYSQTAQKLQSCLGGRDTSLKVAKGAGMDYEFVDESELHKTDTPDPADLNEDGEEIEEWANGDEL